MTKLVAPSAVNIGSPVQHTHDMKRRTSLLTSTCFSSHGCPTRARHCAVGSGEVDAGEHKCLLRAPPAAAVSGRRIPAIGRIRRCQCISNAVPSFPSSPGRALAVDACHGVRDRALLVIDRQLAPMHH
jgi:hypothetical protein